MRLSTDQALRDDPGARAQTELPGPGLVHQHRRGGAVRDLRRGTCGVQTTVENRLQLRERLERGLPQPLIARHLGGSTAVGAGRLHRDDRPVEAAFRPRLRCALLRAQTERVEILTRESTPTGDSVGTLELCRNVHGPARRLGAADIALDVRQQRNPGHRLDAARQTGVDDTGRDLCRDQLHRLLTRTTLGVDGRHAGPLRQARMQPRIAADVRRLLSGLRDAAADHLLDQGRIEVQAFEDSGLHRTQQLRGVQSRQPATTSTDRRPRHIHDHRVTHCSPPRAGISVERDS